MYEALLAVPGSSVTGVSFAQRKPNVRFKGAADNAIFEDKAVSLCLSVLPASRSTGESDELLLYQS